MDVSQNQPPASRSALVLAFVSWKGGVGKSTLAVATALELKSRGASVAVVDLDVNGHAAHTLSWRDDIVFSHLAHTAATNPNSVIGQIRALAASHDFIILDTPGAIESKGAQMALVVPDVIVIPYKPGGPELISTKKTLDMIESLRAERDLDSLSFLVVNQAPRTTLARVWGEELTKDLQDRANASAANGSVYGVHHLLEVQIRSSVAFSEMMVTGKSLREAGRNSKAAAEDVAAMVDQILTQLPGDEQ